MTNTYVLSVVEVQMPRIIQGTQGRVHLLLSDLDGEDFDLVQFDEITLTMKNYPELDETISIECSVDSDSPYECYFDFTEADSDGWLAAPYYAELTFKRYVRDQEVVTSATGYIPEISTMMFYQCISDFEVGETITGAVSGATAVVYSFDSWGDGGAVGEMELIKIVGDFEVEESITSASGEALVVAITSTEYMADRFADEAADFVALAVVEEDEIVIGDDTYVVSGFDSIATDWLTTETDNDDPGEDITYAINTLDPETSEANYIYKTLVFDIYIEESLS